MISGSIFIEDQTVDTKEKWNLVSKMKKKKKKQGGVVKGPRLWIQTDLGLKFCYLTHYLYHFGEVS